MISFWRQLRFLLWKGFLIKKRQKVWLYAELLTPIILFAILAAVRTRDFMESGTQCHFTSKGFPSAGLLPFAQGWLCAFSNKCNLSPTTGDETLEVNGDVGNQSIVVRSIRAFADTLDRIGQHPVIFESAMKTAVEVIHILANMNDTNNEIRVDQIFLPLEDNSTIFEAVGMDPDLGRMLMDSTFTLKGAMNAFHFANDFNDHMFSKFIKDEPFRLFCEHDVFDESFALPGNFELSPSDRKDLCKFTASQIAIHSNHIDALYPMRMVKELGGDWNTLSKLADNPLDQMNSLYNIFGPTLGILQELMGIDWKNRTQLRDEMFCGTDPTDMDESSNVPIGPKVHTPMDEIREKMLEFVRSVTPGQATHDKMECDADIAVNDDLNCTLLESTAFRVFRPLLSGYILVAPDAPVVRELVDKLNDPLRQWAVIRDALFEYSAFADDLQESIHESELSRAVKNLIPFLRKEGLVDDHTIDFLQNLVGEEGKKGTFGEITKNMTDFINTYSPCFFIDRFRVVSNESHLESVAMCLQPYDQYFSGLVFTGLSENATSFPPTTVYKIRHVQSLVDGTDSIADSSGNILARNRPVNDLKYLTFGFSFIQEAVDKLLIKMKTNVSVPMGIYSQQEPFPCVSWDTFNVELFLALFVILSWMIPSCILVKNIVYEKEQRLKELMRIMGLGDTIHFLSWALVSLVLSTVSIIIVSVILKYASILPHINFTFLIFFLLLYSLSSIAMALLISTFFTNANLATAAAALLYFLFFFPWQLSTKAKSPLFTKFTLIFPQTTLGYGFQMISHANDREAGGWEDIPRMLIAEYDVYMWQCLLALTVQIIGFCILSWYISAIYPGVYGVGQRWYFPFTTKYWLPRSMNDVCLEAESVFDGIHSENEQDFESEPRDMRVRVKIDRLSKVYGNNTKALDSLNLRLYEDQITALLGHNGAGKTTTMSILCGLYAPSSGTAQVYGRDLATDMRSVRDVLGVCPQYNVLFSLLTVGEQLKFYAALKGVADKDLDAEVEDIIESIGLTDKTKAMASTLSGGMKRRLCIGMALIGGSKFVILDEPTAGVDVNSRKEIWKLLLKHKQGRTILLSTHHMDEADVLSDRIAILAEGRLRALGSSVFLKKKFGHSYKLTLLKAKARGPNLPPISGWEGVMCTLIEETDDEVVYSIPLDTPSDKLEKFFSSLDKALSTLNSTGYGISAPSLQQIFVSLAPKKEFKLRKQVPNTILHKIRRFFKRKSVDQADQNVLIIGPEGTEIASNGITQDIWNETELSIETETKALNKSHVRALLAAKTHYTKRSILNLTFQIVLPIVLLMGAEIYAKVVNAPKVHIRYRDMVAAPPLLLTTALFGDGPESYLSVNNRSDEWSHRIVESMMRPPGVGVRCLNYTEEEYNPGCYQLEGYNDTFHWINNNLTKIPYNTPQMCGCLPNKGWNCTQDDYPIKDLPMFVSANTTDIIYDLSWRNISQFRLITRFPASIKRAHDIIGGWALGMKNLEAAKENPEMQRKGLAEFVGQMEKAAKEIGVKNPMRNASEVVDPFTGNFTLNDVIYNMLGNLDTKENAKLWFNNKIWPSLPIYYNSLTNAILRSITSDDDTRPDGDESYQGIITFNHPMNSTLEDAIDTKSLMKTILFRIVLIILVLCVVPAGFAVFLVTDRESHSLHLQLVSGLEKKMYWAMEYLFDMIIYTVAIIVILFCYWLVDVPEITQDWMTVAEFLLLFIVYGLCMILIVFCLQRWFAVPALAFVVISIGLFFVGVVATMTVMMIEQLMENDPTLLTPYRWTSNVFLILPQYNLGMAVYRGTFIHQFYRMGAIFLDQINRPDLIHKLPLPSLLSWNLMGKHLVVLICQTILALMALFLLEHESLGVLRRIEGHKTSGLLDSQRVDEDDDVEKEKDRVENLKEAEIEEGLVVKDLAKAYNNHLAVKGISFAVQGGECFGLLGLNGAGKTTTFSMMTGKHYIGHGEVIIQGQKVEHGSSEGFRNLGYCPQFDALNMKLTTKENLTFYARIRGVREDKISDVVASLLLSLHLRPYADVQTAALSGGNRRKLSVAIALVSQPPVIMLDEPSAGMDPGSQQFLWSVIGRLRRAGRAVVLTSHSMEECEALCTRIAIMDEGRMRCIGGKQHLKNKFGEGYTLMMKLPDCNRAAEAARYIEDHVSHSKIEAIHCSTVFCHIPDKGHSVATVLHVVNKLKKQIPLEDFALSQTTLDDIFLSFASHKRTQTEGSAETAETDVTATSSPPPSYTATTEATVDRSNDYVLQSDGSFLTTSAPSSTTDIISF